eukprot:3347083-Rhodomonas_salina.1
MFLNKPLPLLVVFCTTRVGGLFRNNTVPHIAFRAAIRHTSAAHRTQYTRHYSAPEMHVNPPLKPPLPPLQYCPLDPPPTAAA